MELRKALFFFYVRGKQVIFCPKTHGSLLRMMSFMGIAQVSLVCVSRQITMSHHLREYAMQYYPLIAFIFSIIFA